jgi:hypothetical protein
MERWRLKENCIMLFGEHFNPTKTTQADWIIIILNNKVSPTASPTCDTL